MSKENGAKTVNMKSALIVVGIVLGAILLIFGSVSGSDKGKDNENYSNIQKYDEQKYEEELIGKITGICSKVRGAGKVSVAVTLDGSFRAIYAQDIQTDNKSTYKLEYVMKGSGSSEEAILIGYEPPDILGIGIVCTGGKDSGVRSEIISLVAAAFDIPTNKIYVAAAQN